MPVDISRDQLARVASSLAGDYPRLAVRPLCADYTAPLRPPRLPDGARRVEMHLESLADQEVRVSGVRLHLARGETIWTESSYKYDRERLRALAAAAGFRIRRVWTDDRRQFWVTFLTAR